MEQHSRPSPFTYGCLSALAVGGVIAGVAFGWLHLAGHGGYGGLRAVGDALFASLVGTFGAALGAIAAFIVGWLAGRSRQRDWDVSATAAEDD